MRRKPVSAAVVLAAIFSLFSQTQRLPANPIPVGVDYPDVSGNPVRELGANLVVAEPRAYRNLRIFPLLAEDQSGKSFLPIDQAIQRGDLEVKEKGSGEVNTVRVRNNGSSFVFGLAGDMIVGAKQDRMLKSDVLIPAHSGWLEIEVYCTEHGRWTAQTEKFGTINRVVPGELRARAAQTESQSEVWAGVAEAKSELGAAVGGTALRGVYDDDKVQDQARSYVRELLPVPEASARTCGVLVAVGDEILCVDIFASHELFSAMWNKLLNSYVLDALRRHSTGELSSSEAQAFVRSLEDAEIEARHTPGKGRLYRVNTRDGSGSALVFDEHVVHLDLFPGWSGEERDYAPGSTPNLEFRRNRN
jgi:hypothetical protein